jgi:hypothetical protein
MLITLFLLGCLTGIPIGWFASRKNTVILTEQTINEGLSLSKKAAKKRMDDHNTEFKKKIDDLMASTRTQLQNKLGLDNQDPRVHTNDETDDGVNISREARTL